MSPVLVDPNVSKIKFQREVNDLFQHRDVYRKKGWLIEATSFPIVRVTFLTSGAISPVAAPFAVDIDFTNYNLWAPSVRFIHPITLNSQVCKGFRNVNGTPTELIINAHPYTNEVFLCLPGIREYHSHPQHNGDSWDLHRYTGEGTLYFLLDNIWKYCVKNISSYVVDLRLNNSGIVQHGAIQVFLNQISLGQGIIES